MTDNRFKITSTFDPSYGGGYIITVEDLNTGICDEGWAYDKAGVKAAAEGLTQRMSISEAPETFYLEESESSTGEGASEVEDLE